MTRHSTMQSLVSQMDRERVVLQKNGGKSESPSPSWIHFMLMWILVCFCLFICLFVFWEREEEGYKSLLIWCKLLQILFFFLSVEVFCCARFFSIVTKVQINLITYLIINLIKLIIHPMPHRPMAIEGCFVHTKIRIFHIFSRLAHYHCKCSICIFVCRTKRIFLKKKSSKRDLKRCLM